MHGGAAAGLALNPMVLGRGSRGENGESGIPEDPSSSWVGYPGGDILGRGWEGGGGGPPAAARRTRKGDTARARGWGGGARPLPWAARSRRCSRCALR